MTPAAPARILVADDDRLVRLIYADALRAVGHEVETAADGLVAWERLAAEPFDLLLTDLLMPGLDGLELLDRAKRAQPGLEVMVLTSVSTAEPAVQALRNGAFHYLVKPIDPEALQLEVRRCLDSRRILLENRELRRSRDLLTAAQRISACLEFERLHLLAVDTLLALVPSDAGFLLRHNADDVLEIPGLRGLPSEAANLLAELLWAEQGATLASAPEPVAMGGLGRLIPASEPGLRHIEHALLVPLYRDGRALGVAVLLRGDLRKGFSAEHARDAAFLGEAIGLALDNAAHFLQARLVAHLDALTGLFNAAHLEHVVDREIRSRAESARPFSLLFMDLDHFKRVNDTHGHQVGSRVLVEFSRLLRRCTREGDVLVRYGGDEFVVILPDADTDLARCAAERIRRSVEGHQFLSREGLMLSLTLCAGICTWPRHARTREDVIHRADLAMYHGKKTHRNAVHVHEALDPPDDATP